MTRAYGAIALGLVMGVMFGLGSGRAMAQGALGAAGMSRPSTPAARTVSVPSTPVRRYYYFDARTRRYYYYDVPVTSGTTYRSNYAAPAATPSVSRRGMLNGRRNAMGIGAQGTDGRTNPDEWMEP